MLKLNKNKINFSHYIRFWHVSENLILYIIKNKEAAIAEIAASLFFQ